MLDASAVMALLHDEAGSSVVVDAIAAGTTISVVNWAEVLSKVAGEGDDPEAVASRLGVTGDEVVIWVEALTAADCIEVAHMRPITKARGLSLADRAARRLILGLASSADEINEYERAALEHRAFRELMALLGTGE